MLDEVQEGGLAPLHIIEDDCEGAPPGDALVQGADRSECLLTRRRRLRQPDDRCDLIGDRRSVRVCQQGPDLVSDFGGGVSVADTSRLLDRLDNRPECQSLAVPRASAPAPLRLRTCRPQKLVHEARFADPRWPEERKELARLVGGRLFEGGPELPALAVSTNER